MEYILAIECIEGEYMRKKELSRTEKEILHRIALDGYKTDYELSEKDKIAADSTVYNALRKLKDLDLIEIKREEKFERIPNRIVKKYYGLTFLGLITALKTPAKLHLIKNREELATEWIEKTKKIIAEKKLAQIFGITELKKDERIEYLQNLLLKEMKSCPPELETFLQHYDLNHSDNSLIFGEWLWHIVTSHFYEKGVKP